MITPNYIKAVDNLTNYLSNVKQTFLFIIDIKYIKYI